MSRDFNLGNSGIFYIKLFIRIFKTSQVEYYLRNKNYTIVTEILETLNDVLISNICKNEPD